MVVLGHSASYSLAVFVPPAFHWRQNLFKRILPDMLIEKYLDPQATPLSYVYYTALLGSVLDIIVVRE